MIVHLNSQLVPLSEARISPLDRGFIFGDALYEGLRAFNGRIVGAALHARRLAEGLREIRFVGQPDQRDLKIQRVIQRSGVRGRVPGQTA